VIDATLTLFRRILRKQKIYEAHRSHSYQFAARRYGSHIPVTLAFAAINLFWLLPIAVTVVDGHVTPFIAVIIAWIPLVGTALYFRAGSAGY
jgi:Fuc2NAc and GlcNAc transferase